MQAPGFGSTALSMWIWRFQADSYNSRSEPGAVVVAAEVLQTNSNSERVVMGVECSCAERERCAKQYTECSATSARDFFSSELSDGSST
jgi:hypothetical protein